MADWMSISKRMAMIGSDYEGEVIAAANALKKCMRAENISFADLATRLVTGPNKYESSSDFKSNPPLKPRAKSPFATNISLAKQMLQASNLSPKEWKFVSDVMSMMERGYQMSERQSDWFDALVRRHENS
jgi:hypothetical protein